MSQQATGILVKDIVKNLQYLKNTMSSIADLFTPDKVQKGTNAQISLKNQFDKRLEDANIIFEQLVRRNIAGAPTQAISKYFEDKDVCMTFSTAFFESALSMAQTFNCFFDPSHCTENSMEILLRQPEYFRLMVQGIIVAYTELEMYISYTRKSLEEFRKANFAYRTFYSAINCDKFFYKFNPMLQTEYCVAPNVYNLSDFENVFTVTEKVLAEFYRFFRLSGIYEPSPDIRKEDIEQYVRKMTNFCAPSLITTQKPPKNLAMKFSGNTTPALAGFLDAPEREATRTITERGVMTSILNDTTPYQTGSLADIYKYLDEGHKTSLWGFGDEDKLVFTAIEKERLDVDVEKIQELKFTTFNQKLDSFLKTYQEFVDARRQSQRTPEQYSADEVKVLTAMSGILNNLIAELQKYDAHMKKYFVDETTKDTGIPQEIIQDILFMCNSSDQFVASVLTNIPKIAMMTDKYTKLLMLGLKFKGELDKEVRTNIESYEITQTLANMLQNTAFQRTSIECLINYDKVMFTAMAKFVKSINLNIQQFVAELIEANLYYTHSVFNFTPPDLFFLDEVSEADLEYATSLIESTSFKVVATASYLTNELDLMEMHNTQTTVDELFDKGKRTNVKQLIVSPKYVEDVQRGKVLGLFSQFVTDDSTAEAKIIADNVGGDFEIGFCLNAFSVKQSAFPLMFAFANEFYMMFFILNNSEAEVTTFIDSLFGEYANTSKTYYYWNYLMKIVSLYFLRIGKMQSYLEPTGVLTCQVVIPGNMSTWLTLNTVSPGANLVNSTAAKDWSRSQSKLTATATSLTLNINEQRSSAVEINTAILEKFSKMNYATHTAKSAIDTLNKNMAQLLKNSGSAAADQQYTINFAAGAQLKMLEIVQLMASIPFLNYNQKCFYFSGDAAMFIPISVYCQLTGTPVKRGIIKQIVFIV